MKRLPVCFATVVAVTTIRDEFGDWVSKGTEKTNKFTDLASCPL